MMIINSIEEAFAYYLANYCTKHDSVEGIKPIFGDRGTFCFTYYKSDIKHYFTFNRDWFYSFSKIFTQVEELGIGQSFKLSMLNGAEKDRAIIVTMMPNTDAYFVPATEAADYVHTNKTFRIPSTETVHEGSIPARMLQRLQRPGRASSNRQATLD